MMLNCWNFIEVRLSKMFLIILYIIMIFITFLMLVSGCVTTETDVIIALAAIIIASLFWHLTLLSVIISGLYVLLKGGDEE